MRRAFSLVELMVSVAILGILVAGPAAVVRADRQRGLAEVQRARALLLLEAEADAAARGRAVPAEVEERLRAGLPDAEVERAAGDGLVTLTVRWRSATGGAASRSLTVFAR